jgi:cytidine deaminase
VADPEAEASGPSAGPDLDLDRLVDEAREARSRAYAPYSRFFVGAALITDQGNHVSGANVENASYGLSICAERVAAAMAVAAGARKIEAVALTSSAPTPTPPCGACRQFLYEFNPEMTIVSEGSNGERKEWRLSELLPDGFRPEDLEVTR